MWTGLDEDCRLNLSNFPFCPKKRPPFLVMALNLLYARMHALMPLLRWSSWFSSFECKSNYSYNNDYYDDDQKEEQFWS
jgi:hypothetical protein